MKKNRLLPLFLLTVVVVVIAIVTARKQTPTVEQEHALLFPELKTTINDLNELSVQQGSKTLTLDNEAGTWKVREADGHPALFSKIKQAAIAVSELRVLEEKTKDPQQYATLGVEDPAADKAESRLLTLKDKSGKQLAALIVGKNRISRAAAGNQGLYVRLPGQAQALLVAGDLDVGVAAADWMDKNLVNIAAERIRQIDIAHGDTRLSLRRDKADANLVPDPIPAGKRARSDYVAERMAGILDNITLDDVKAAAKVEFPADAVTTTVRTNDGLTAVITSAAIDSKDYARFTFQYTASAQPEAATAPAPETKPAAAQPAQAPAEGAKKEEQPAAPKRDVAREVADLNAKTAGWVYQIPSYKFDTFTRKLDDLIEDLPKEEPARKATKK